MKGKLNYKKYWEDRYKNGGNSGAGSYNELATFKADVINEFIQKKNIDSAIEVGCGDGNNQKIYLITNYLGLDVSKYIIDQNQVKFASGSKHFLPYTPSEFFNNGIITADVVLCQQLMLARTNT